MRLEISYRKKTVKNTNTWRLNSALVNNQEITEEIKEEIKRNLQVAHAAQYQKKQTTQCKNRQKT